MTLWGGLPLTSHISLELIELIGSWSVPLCAALALVCAAAGFTAFRSAKPASSRAAVSIAAAAAAAMAAGYPLAAWTGGVGLCVCAGAMLLAAGMAASFCLWCLVFSRMGAPRAAESALVSVVVSSALSLATFGLAVEDLEAAFFAAVVLSALSLAYALRDARASCADASCGARRLRHGAGAFSSLRSLLEGVRVPLLCACAIAFAVAITRMMSLTAAPGMAAAVNMLGVLAAAIAAVALLLFARKKGREGLSIGIPSLFQVLFPLVATLLLVMSVAGPVASAAVGAAVFALYSIMFALVMPACIEGAEEEGAPCVAVYGFFVGAVYALFASATYLGVVLFERGESEASVSFVAVLLVLYVLAMADAIVHRRARASAAMRPHAEDACAAGENPSAIGEAHAAETACVGADARLAARAASKGAAADGRGPAGEGDGGKRAPSEARRDQAHAAPRSGERSDEDPSVRKPEDPIERRCLNVARAYGLSPRETDVLVAFAHGRNVAYLAEHLVLSTNTIRSHSKTLYAKLGVHSKQELIDLVEREG